jgi:sec-independent protein translocase protein TatA
VRALVLAKINALDRLCGERSDGVLERLRWAGQGEHGAMVVLVGVEIEKIRATRSGQTFYRRDLTSFADVDDALEKSHFLVFRGPADMEAGVREYRRGMVANIFGPDLGIVILVILVVLIGGSQLPKIARNVGTAGREFRKAQQEADEDAERDQAAKTSPPPQAVGPAPAPVPTPPPVPREESVTLTRSELDALLKAREEQARREDTGSSDASGSTS